MKKQFLSFIVLSGLMSGHIGCAELTKKSSWKQQAKEAAMYEKNVWAKGLPAAYKKWINRKSLTKQEQMYYAALRNQVGIVAILAALFGGKKIYDVRREQRAKQEQRAQHLQRQKQEEQEREKKYEQLKVQRAEKKAKEVVIEKIILREYGDLEPQLFELKEKEFEQLEEQIEQRRNELIKKELGELRRARSIEEEFHVEEEDEPLLGPKPKRLGLDDSLKGFVDSLKEIAKFESKFEEKERSKILDFNARLNTIMFGDLPDQLKQRELEAVGKALGEFRKGLSEKYGK